MNEMPWVATVILSPVVSFIIYYLKKDKDDSSKMTNLMIKEYIDSLRINNEVIKVALETLKEQGSDIKEIKLLQKEILEKFNGGNYDR